ncbi:hypothetical protein TNCV_2731591 [Trichonephila clavipes]|nr:hypothetical protein TNCV_2731591 [Trichonephila clavipes]
MGGRRSPSYNGKSLYICPGHRKRIFMNVEGGAQVNGLYGGRSGTACWPIGIVKFTARTLKRMIFLWWSTTRVGARILGALPSRPPKPPQPEAHLLPEVNSRRSLSFKS